MTEAFKPLIKTLQFIKNVLGCNHDIIINTRINKYNDPNQEFHKHKYDIYTMNAIPKIKIDNIIELFEYMQNQLDQFDDDCENSSRIFFDGFKFNKNMYYANFKCFNDIDFYSSGMNNSIDMMKFIKDIIGTNKNVYFHSHIFDHNSGPERLQFNLNQDMHCIYGNDDKPINITDIITLFDDLQTQSNEVYEKDTGRSYYYEGIVIQKDYRNDIMYRIFWGS